MKKIFTFLAAATLIVGCSKTDEAQPSSYTITGYAVADTRTEFGTPGDDTIPFLWSQGDKVWVGSKQSYALAAGGESATFTLSSAPQDGVAVYYNMTGSGATASVPTAQDAANSLGLNGDFGYATLSGNSFALEHATSYLWFDVTTTGFDATLLSVTVDAGDAAIAGSATWSGQAFGQVNNPTSTITLEVGANVAMPAMVVLPTEVSALTVTYKFDVGGVTKYYGQTLGAKTLAAGKTYKISANDLYELRTLTFEDADAKFTAYSLDYAPKDIRTWSNLVDDAQYGGTLTYSYGGEYYWYDEGNTELFHSFTTPLWGGGHVISNYVIEDYSTLPDGHSGWYELQMANPIGGHNGSANFAVHNGYSDFFNSQIYDASLQTLEFADDEEHVIDHMWVTNTNYVLNSLTYGDGFNAPATASTYVKVIAYGYDANDNETGSVEIYLCKDGVCLTEWAKWDLSSLGKVAKVAFNFAASEDQSGQYGLNCPAYFAYDDVTVRF
jgi:hypothetical protein